MRVEEHIAIAAESLRRGLIDQYTLRQAVQHIMASSTPLVSEQIWIDSGWLSRDELAAVLTAIRAEARAQSDKVARVDRAAGSNHLTRRAKRISQSAYEVTVERHPGEGVATNSSDTEIAVDHPLGDAGEIEDSGTATSPHFAESPTALANGMVSSSASLAEVDGEERYRFVRVLGRGGLGEVHECVDPILGRSVALKHARPQQTNAGRVIIEHEARILAQLEHPNIVPVYDAGKSRGLGPYYVMRVLNQASLDEILKRIERGDQEALAEYTQGRLLRYFVQVCNAAEYAHRRGIVHCDLKPENVLLGTYGEVLVVDWGMSRNLDQDDGPRGGTPGYMAPEQLTPDGAVDGRADVFALGAILYRIVARSPAFPEAPSVSEPNRSLLTVYHQLVAPSQRQPDRDIRPELDEICMRALQMERDHRHPSARALADDVEAYLEGRKEVSRRNREADRCVENGDDLAARYHESVESRPHLLRALHEAQRTTPPWAPAEEKENLWDAEDVLRVTDSLRRRMFQAAVAAYEQALEQVSNHAAARKGLAGLYRSALNRARSERDELDIVHYTRLLRSYDDSFAVSEPTGTLRLRFSAAGLVSVLYRIAGMERRSQLEEVRNLEISSESSTADEVLSPGHYLLKVRSRKHATVHYPVVIEAGQVVMLDVAPPTKDRLRAGEIFIPAGVAYLGEAGPRGTLREPTEAYVGPFVIQRTPVTFRDYLAYIDDLRAKDLQSASARIPRTILGQPRWQRDGDQWTATDRFEWNQHPQSLDLPVIGISFADAQAYAEWYASQCNLPYRLPTEAEWEKAARGTDGRLFPWGNQFDASFCKMRFSSDGPPVPAPSGQFPSDESPYGVLDMAGGVADWIVPDRTANTFQSERGRLILSRGGAWCDWEDDCRLTSRREYRSDEVTARVGFRLVRSLNPMGG